MEKNSDAGLRFETPENIRVSYQPAGLGTRFIAWFVDNILVTFGMLVIFFALVCAGVATESVAREVLTPLEQIGDEMQQGGPDQIPNFLWYALGLCFLIWGLGGFVYFGCCEWLMRGQTLGKRICEIRVVKVDGFSLDAGGVFVRNIFRVVDHLPPLWIVPVLSAKSQRFGDMVAGTAVVSEKAEEISHVRGRLAHRSGAENRFRFEPTRLKRLRPQDFEAIERILERWSRLTQKEEEALLDQLLPPLVKRLELDQPAEKDRLAFLEDLLAAEYRRQSRELG